MSAERKGEALDKIHLYALLTIAGAFAAASLLMELFEVDKPLVTQALIALLVAATAAQVYRLTTRMDERLSGIEKMVSAIHSRDWGDLESRFYSGLEPELRHRLEGYFNKRMTELKDARENARLRIGSREEFAAIYASAFAEYKDARVIGTSRTNKDYFWTRDDEDPLPAELAMKSFCDKAGGRGQIERIFYVEPNWRVDPQSVGVLKRQCDFGVTVYTAEPSTEGGSEDLFVLFTSQGFGWTAYAEGGVLKGFEFTQNPADIKRHTDTFNRLKAARAKLRSGEYIANLHQQLAARGSMSPPVAMPPTPAGSQI